MPSILVIYGAYGYTGELVARHAVERGLAPVLAGRDSERLARLARELGCPWRAFPLSDPDAVRRGVEDAGAVLHCAGPFAATYRPMAEACLDARVHYLDLTGEPQVLGAVAEMGPHAQRAGVMLLPGAGFDVAATDCLAAHLVRRLPAAKKLVLALSGLARPSRGTARTILAGAGDLRGWRPPPGTPALRTFDLGRGPVSAVPVPWPDLVTAPRSTGVGDVTVYLQASAALRALLRAAPLAAPLLGEAPLREAGAWLLSSGERGPGPEARAAGRSVVHGEAEDAAGGRVAARLVLPDAYAFTALVAVEMALRTLRGPVPPGWQTPSSAFGPDLPLALPGVTRVELP